MSNAADQPHLSLKGPQHGRDTRRASESMLTLVGGKRGTGASWLIRSA